MIVSIVVSTKGTEVAHMTRTLDSLGANLIDGVEIIIVDQNDDRRMEPVVKNYDTAQIQYIPMRASGLSRGRNEGARHASGQWLWFLDDDIELPKTTILALLTRLQSPGQRKQALYGRVVDQNTGRDYLTRATHASTLSPVRFDGVCSVGLLVTRELFFELGGFDERFGVGAQYGAGEEADLVLRVMQTHVAIPYFHDLVVYHDRESVDAGKSERYGNGMGAVYRKHLFDSVSFFLILIFRFCIEVVGRGVLMFLQKSRRAAHRAYVKGFITGFFSYENSNRE